MYLKSNEKVKSVSVIDQIMSVIIKQHTLSLACLFNLEFGHFGRLVSPHEIFCINTQLRSLVSVYSLYLGTSYDFHFDKSVATASFFDLRTQMAA